MPDVLTVLDSRGSRRCAILCCDERLSVRSACDAEYRYSGYRPTNPTVEVPMASNTKPTTRQAAIVGGNRIPFARSNSKYAQASNQDMLTATLDGLVARFGLQGKQLGEVVAGAVLKHSRDFNLTRESVLGSKLSADDAGLRRPAGLRHRPRGRDPGREQDRARPDRVRHRRRRRHDVRRPARRGRRPAPRADQPEQRQDAAGPAQGARRASGPASSCRRSRATPSRAPAWRWASTPRSPPRSGRSAARSRTSSPSARTSNLAAAYDRGFFDDLVTPFLGLDPRPEPAAGLHGGEARQAQAGVRQGRGRHDDRRPTRPR